MIKKIKIKDIDSIYFAGPKDQNIKLIESRFNSQIVLRGDELIVEGKKSEIESISQLVNNII